MSALTPTPAVPCPAAGEGPSGVLLRTPAPRVDESLLGYLARLVEGNGYDSPNWLLELSALPVAIRGRTALVFQADTAPLASLARLVGVGVEWLATLRCPPADPSRSLGDCLLFGQPVPRYLVRPGRPRVCPGCLRESAYLRRVWEFAPVTACARHRCALLDGCPACGKRLSWARKEVCVCPCGCDWRDVVIPAPLPPAETAVSDHVLRLLGVGADAPAAGEEVPPVLADLSLRGFVCALFFVAGQMEGIMDVQGKRLAGSRRNASLHALLCRAWAVFGGWPENFHAFLDWRRGQVAPARHGSGLKRDFLEYKAALYGRRVPAELGFLRVAFEDYLRRRWTGGVVGKLRRQAFTAGSGTAYLSRKQASRVLHIPGEGVDALLECGLLAGTSRTAGRSRLVLIEFSGVHRLKARLDQALYLGDVSRLLGLSRKAIAGLGREGVLTLLRGPTVDGNADWRFAREDVEVLLRIPVETGVAVPVTQRWSFLHASRYLRRVGVNLAGVVRLVREGRLRPCNRGGKAGLAGLEFHRETVVMLAHEVTGGNATSG